MTLPQDFGDTQPPLSRKERTYSERVAGGIDVLRAQRAGATGVRDKRLRLDRTPVVTVVAVEDRHIFRRPNLPAMALRLCVRCAMATRLRIFALAMAAMVQIKCDGSVLSAKSVFIRVQTCDARCLRWLRDVMVATRPRPRVRAVRICG